MVLDNLNSHKTVLPMFSSHFKVMYMPPFSPRFNNCEHYFGLLKRRFKVKMQLKLIDNTDW